MPWNLTSKQCTGAVAQKMHRGLKHKTTKEDISECTAACYRTDKTSRLLQYLKNRKIKNIHVQMVVMFIGREEARAGQPAPPRGAGAAAAKA